MSGVNGCRSERGNVLELNHVEHLAQVTPPQWPYVLPGFLDQLVVDGSGIGRSSGDEEMTAMPPVRASINPISNAGRVHRMGINRTTSMRLPEPTPQVSVVAHPACHHTW